MTLRAYRTLALATSWTRAWLRPAGRDKHCWITARRRRILRRARRQLTASPTTTTGEPA